MPTTQAVTVKYRPGLIDSIARQYQLTDRTLARVLDVPLTYVQEARKNQQGARLRMITAMCQTFNLELKQVAMLESGKAE